MSSKNCPETARQKMINMMYIVLTALLALNVAAEVLDAFKVVDSSLIQTYNSIDAKNKNLFLGFENAFKDNPTKVAPWKAKAYKVAQLTQTMTSKIEAIKEELAQKSGYEKVTKPSKHDICITLSNNKLWKLKKPDDLNVPSEVMITKQRATELKKAIITYKQELLSLLDSNNISLYKSIEQQLDVADPTVDIAEGGLTYNWEEQYFANKPLIAVITVLSKLQIDVKNAEESVISHFYEQIDAKSFKFNKLSAQVLPVSSHVIQGDDYEAKVLLVATDTTQYPEIFVGNDKLPIIDGKGVYKVKSNTDGAFTWKGFIRYKTPSGSTNVYPFEETYYVNKPMVTISPTKMNVFYLNIQNPVSISAPGVSQNMLDIEITNGSITPAANGAFTVVPKSEDENGSKTKISVYAKSNDGLQRKFVGAMNFRVKRVPDPVAMVGNKKGGNINKEDLLLEDGILATLENFEFDLRFNITSFDVTLSSGGYVQTWKSESNQFTAAQKEQFKRLSRGNIVYIDNIIARGEDRTVRQLSPASFRIQ